MDPREARDPSAPLANDEVLLELSRDLRRLAGHLVRDPGTADDVVQEAWLAALDRPAGEVRSLGDWMRTIVRRLAAKRARRERRRADVEALVASRDEVEFDAELDARLTTQRLLREVVDEVPEPARAVLVAHYFEGHALDSVAAALGRPLETVRTQRRRGLAQLREALDRRHKGDRSAWSGLLLAFSGREGSALRAGSRRVAVGAAALLVATAIVYFALEGAADRSEPGRTADVAVLPAPEAGGTAPDAVRSADRGETARAPVVANEPAPAPPASAPTPPAAAKHRLAVRVVAADGSPVPDAVISITGSLDAPDLPPRRTDGHGRAVLELDAAELMGAPLFDPPAGGVAIRARAEGHAYSLTSYVPMPEGNSEFEIVLGGPEQIADVRVVDESGAPVPNARVEVDKRRAGLARGADGVLSTNSAVGGVTDAEGRVRLANLALREHEIDVAAAGFVLHTARMPDVEPRVAVLVRLERGATLAGEVRRADGSPVAGATVVAPRPEFHREAPPGTTTDAEGRFRLSGLAAGSLRIFARGPAPADGFADAIVELEGHGETWTSITLRERAPLTIRVQDVLSRDVAGIMIVLATPRGVVPAWQTIARIDAQGTCAIDAFPSEALDCVAVRGSDGHLYKRLTIDARVPEELFLLVDVGADAAQAALQGRVLDANGAPLTGAYVHEIRDGRVALGGWIVDAATGAYASTLVANGAARWLVVSREGVAELGSATIEAGATIDLGTVYAPRPGRARIAWTTPPAPGARIELRHRTSTEAGIAEGRVHDFPADVGALDLLPYEYVVRVPGTEGSSSSNVTFRVTSGAEVEVVLP